MQRKSGKADFGSFSRLFLVSLSPSSFHGINTRYWQPQQAPGFYGDPTYTDGSGGNTATSVMPITQHRVACQRFGNAAASSLSVSSRSRIYSMWWRR